ncbi:MAG: electron transfer flavoprotein subunit alpha [Pseudopedobacter saltans]|uniref:Electron transfer flavoprotein subunit beta n=1 Tax=Pseudopedobacter saltans TaxID=151895 RepID=A0A2W5F1L9_9SPHI|nr:MAG: electron transfer flavoprotein subunit alpha [Pseudopedobacter saltans]
MKILVPISQVPDTTAKISFTDNDTELNAAGVAFIINPYDEWYALVRALELKESGKAEKVTVIHVGPAANEATIRKALAIGADDAVRIDGDGDSSFVAGQISDYAKSNGYELIMLGKETISYNSAATGALIAGDLNWNYIPLATKLEIDGSNATLEQDADGGISELLATLPLVISCAKGMAEQRIPNMRGIMAARTKPLAVVTPSSDYASLTNVVSYKPSEGRKACVMISEDNVEELVELLHTKARVI